MRRKHLGLLLALTTALLLLFSLIPIAQAQDYRFSVDAEVVDVWINYDGSVSLNYSFAFTNYGDSFNVVDVGLPTDDFELSDVRAYVGQKQIYDIEEADPQYVKYGVTIWLDGDSIPTGKTGTVRVVVDRVGGMVYEDSKDEAYASCQFMPHYFDPSLVDGTTELTVRFHLPEGVGSEEPRWHSSPSGWPQDEPSTAFDDERRVLYTWYNPAASNKESTRKNYKFGASFPREYVSETAVQKAPPALLTWLPSVLRFFCNPIPIIAIFILGFILIMRRVQSARKMSYLPPSMKVEGVGIKRGLTAVEAAIVLQTPLDRVLTMILFGLLKKGAVTVLEDDPLRAQINEPLSEKLRPYEKDFLLAVRKDGSLNEKHLRGVMIELVKAVNNKMKGFSRKETVAYYQDIVRRAWLQVEGAETPEVRGQLFGEGLEWAMLDEDFEKRTEHTFSEGPVYVPVWWGHYRPWARTLPAAGPARMPTLPGADFAAKIVRGVSDTAGRIVRSVTSFTSGVTKVTNPPPAPSSRSWSSGSSGGGCACACACACAGCACACAGGGR